MVERNGTRPCGHRSAKVSLLLVLACVASLAGCDATGDSNDPAGPAAEKPAAAVDASTSAASETSKGQSAAAVTEADPSDYTSFLSETDVKAETPELAEVKKVTVKYPGGRVKSEFSLNVFKNGPPAFHGTYKEWYENGQVWKEGEYVNGRKIGAWKFWAEDGKLLKSGAYVDGHPDGKFTYYGPGEVRSRVESYAAGKNHGDWIEYDPSGKYILQKQPFRDGKLHGTVVTYFPPETGQEGPLQKSREIQFVEGRQHGTTTEWFANGQMRIKLEFRNGKRHGQATEWDETGKVVRQREFRDGEPVNESVIPGQSSARDLLPLTRRLAARETIEP